jgi:hypothetical protein
MNGGDGKDERDQMGFNFGSWKRLLDQNWGSQL